MHLGGLGAQHAPRDVRPKLFAPNARQALDIGADFSGHAVLPLIDRAARTIELPRELRHAASLLEGSLDWGQHGPKYRFTRQATSRESRQAKSYEDARPYPESVDFKTRLKRAREGAGWSGQSLGKEVAKRLGLEKAITRQTISHWEMGHHEPSLAQLKALCDVLNVTPTVLIVGPAPELSPAAIKYARRFDAMSPEERKLYEEALIFASKMAAGTSKEPKTPAAGEMRPKRRRAFDLTPAAAAKRKAAGG